MLKKICVAWLQLRYQRTRFIIALAGVAFAVLIIFMQFGLRDALFDSAVRIHKSIAGDCFLISPRSNALMSMESFAERRLIQTLGLSEVEFVSPVYIGFAQWQNPQVKDYWRKVFVIGFNVEQAIFKIPGVNENLDKLKYPDQVIFDRYARHEFGDIAAIYQSKGEVVSELSQARANRKVKVVGLFDLGSSFGADGSLITSDLNFLRIFRNRPKGLIEIGVIKLKTGISSEKFADKLREFLPKDVRVFTKDEFIAFEKKYWKSSTAIGFIFSLGVVLGLIVGMAFVYQILYANVSEQLAQYATLKAIGYRHNYLLFIILQQSLLIGVLGYIPGFLLSIVQYEYTKTATLLPVTMTLTRAIFVLVLTIAMCSISGILTLRKLKSADPADIF